MTNPEVVSVTEDRADVGDPVSRRRLGLFAMGQLGLQRSECERSSEDGNTELRVTHNQQL
jgi:hypothetical protein